jgi:hypothetical protein
MFWVPLASLLLVFNSEITCKDGIPGKAYLLFFYGQLLCLFVEVFVAVHTREGYLMLTERPSELVLVICFSCLGRFDAFSDITFVKIAYDCGHVLWKISLGLVVVGVVGVQVCLGLY